MSTSVENFALIWLDFDGERTLDDYRPSVRHLEPLLQTIEVIFNQDEFLCTIEALDCEKLFLIVSGKFARQWVVELAANARIESIYLHCREIDPHDEPIGKVKGTFSDVPSIFDALRRDIRRLHVDLVPIELWNSLELSSCALSSSILRCALIDNDRHASIEFFRQRYARNAHELQIVEEFARNAYREYSPMQWYTRECFLFRMIQRAFRTLDTEILYHLSSFIRDLHRQIVEIHRSTRKIGEQRTIFYAQSFSADEFRTLTRQTDGLFTFRTFVFGTTDESLALFHAEEASTLAERLPVLFHIHIDQSVPTFPYANVGEFDFFHDSDGHVLFSFNAVFRLISVAKRSQRVYQIDLILTNENDETIRLIDRAIATNFHSTNHFLRLAEALDHQQQFDRAANLLQLILEEKKRIDPNEIAWIQMKLGDLAAEKGQWSKALAHFDTRLTLEISSFPADEQNLGFLYGKIGWVENERSHLDEAAANFQRAVEHSANAPPLTLAVYHDRLGDIYSKKKEKVAARRHWHSALDCLARSERPDRQLVKRLEEKTSSENK